MADRSHLRVLNGNQSSQDVQPPQTGLWYIRVTFGGAPVPDAQLARALRRLTDANPVGMAVRYAVDRAEVSYWDEAPDAEDAAAMALRVWHEHRTKLGLPDWQVVALEVYDRDTWHSRQAPGSAVSLTSSVTRLHP